MSNKISQSAKAPLAIGKILAWIAGVGLTLAGIFWGGVKLVAWQQIKEDRAIKADTSIIQEQRLIRKDINFILTHIQVYDNQIQGLQGSYKALDNSYVRTLEKWLKDKDEVIKYQRERIQILDSIVKKN